MRRTLHEHRRPQARPPDGRLTPAQGDDGGGHPAGDRRSTPVRCCTASTWSPAVLLRDSTERPEALETGSIVLSGLAAEEVLAAIDVATRTGPGRCPVDYEVTDMSLRVVNAVLSAASRHHEWAGIRRPVPAAGEGGPPWR
ncbi:hypothetical protein [Krasilnikovia sp. MM14-A1004]|uniref:hypothetical protein n=1 Tax=Krasilnikovia sp. MM14-A1004 TaxID=3373541 RepID=UPI00399D0D89